MTSPTGKEMITMHIAHYFKKIGQLIVIGKEGGRLVPNFFLIYKTAFCDVKSNWSAPWF